MLARVDPPRDDLLFLRVSDALLNRHLRVNSHLAGILGFPLFGLTSQLGPQNFASDIVPGLPSIIGIMQPPRLFHGLFSFSSGVIHFTTPNCNIPIASRFLLFP